MHVSYSRTFKKMFRRLPITLQNAFETRLELFIENQTHPRLSTHALKGEWLGCMSINVTGDIRAIFEKISHNHVEFVAIGSHSELYS